MTTYTYTGRLTDYGEAPFPNASPRVWIEARTPGFTGGSVLATRRIPITLDGSGAFTVQLVASTDTVPPAQYVLKVEWLGSGGVVAGWTEVEFTALVGGGLISSGVGAPPSVWFVGPPWPQSNPPGFYLNRITNDVGRKI